MAGNTGPWFTCSPPTVVLLCAWASISPSGVNPARSATTKQSKNGLKNWLARIGRDRKSTRLNSSHGSNSYAVFCLKKKKNKDETKRNRTYQHGLKNHPMDQKRFVCDPRKVKVVATKAGSN